MKVFRRTWKRPDGSIATSRYWSIAFGYKGRERVEGTKCETETAAKQALRRRIEEVGRNQFLPGRTPTIREAAAEWLESKKIAESKHGGPVKESTIEHWENHITKYINPVLGDYRCDRVDTRMVERARDIWASPSWSGRYRDGVPVFWLSPKSVNKVATTLQAIFQKQINLGTLRFNPAEAAERLAVGSNEVREVGGDIEMLPYGRLAEAIDCRKSVEVRPDEVYSPDEVRRLIDAADPGFDRTILAVFALTMLRHGEGLALMWQDIDFEAKEITVRRSWSGRYRDGVPVFWIPKTKSGIRKVSISDELIAMLKEWKLRCPVSQWDLVFPNAKGQPQNRKTTWKAMQAAITKAGIKKLTVHALRHTGCSIHLALGTPLPEVSAMMGHSSVSVTTSIYSHFVPSLRSEAASRMAAAVFQSAKSEKRTEER